MKIFSYLWQYLAEFFWEWKIFQIKFVGKIEAHTLCSVTISPRKSCRLWDNVQKRSATTEAADNMANACCMMDKYSYTRLCPYAHIHT